MWKSNVSVQTYTVSDYENPDNVVLAACISLVDSLYFGGCKTMINVNILQWRHAKTLGEFQIRALVFSYVPNTFFYNEGLWGKQNYLIFFVFN